MYTQPKLIIQPRLTEIAEGMDVYDDDGVQVGEVSAVLFGAGKAKTEQSSEADMINAVWETLGYSTDLPMALYLRLYEEGFICVDRGTLSRDLIVLPTQIDRIFSNSIFLTVEREALLTIYPSGAPVQLEMDNLGN